MTQYADPIAGYSLGADPLTIDWTDPTAGHGSSSIVSDTTPVGDRRWRFTVTASNTGGQGQDVLYTPVGAAASDFDELLLFRRGANAQMIGATTRYQGTTAQYWGGVRNNVSDGRIQQDPTSIAIAAHGLGNPTNAWVWARMQARGTALKLKLWTGAYGDQPGTWLIETTHSGVTGAGAAGIHTYASSTVDVAFFSVGTGTDDAPGPGGGGGGGFQSAWARHANGLVLPQRAA